MCAVDTATVLPMYNKSIMGAMTDSTYRELSVIVSKGLTLLIRSNQLALEEEEKKEDEQEINSDSESETDAEIQEGKIKDEDLGEEIVDILWIPNF